MNKHLTYLKELYFLPFRMLAVLVQIYAANRDRLSQLMARPRAAGIFKFCVLATAFVWLLIAVIVSNDGPDRLGEAVGQLWSQTTGQN